MKVSGPSNPQKLALAPKLEGEINHFYGQLEGLVDLPSEWFAPDKQPRRLSRSSDQTSGLAELLSLLDAVLVDAKAADPHVASDPDARKKGTLKLDLKGTWTFWGNVV